MFNCRSSVKFTSICAILLALSFCGSVQADRNDEHHLFYRQTTHRPTAHHTTHRPPPTHHSTTRHRTTTHKSTIETTTTPWDPFTDPTTTDAEWTTTTDETTGGPVTLKPRNHTTQMPTKKPKPTKPIWTTTVAFTTSTMSPNDSSADTLLKQSAVVISWGSFGMAVGAIGASVLLNLIAWLIFYASYLEPVSRFRQVRDKIMFAEALIVRRVMRDELIGQLNVKADFNIRQAMEEDSSTVLDSIRNVPGPQMFAKYRGA